MDEQNQEEVVKETTPETPEEETGKKQTGSIIGSIIVIVILIIGGLYFWGSRTTDTAETTDDLTADPTLEEIIGGPDPVLEAMEDVSESDELDNIEDDLNLTDIDAIDADADQVE